MFFNPYPAYHNNCRGVQQDKDILGIEHKHANYFKRNCRFRADLDFLLKYFLKNALVSKISMKRLIVGCLVAMIFVKYLMNTA